MIGETDDGRLLPAAFPFFTGRLSIQTVGTQVMAAYFGTLSREEAAAAVGQTGVIGARRYTVLSIRKSPVSRHMVRMTVEPDQETSDVMGG